MSSTKAQNQSDKPKQNILFKKDVTFNIRENIISKQFILRAIKSFLEKNNDFKEDLLVKSPLGDSMVMNIEKGGKKIVVSTKHENDITLNIKGDPDLLKMFVHDITLEAVTSVASEFTGCIIKSINPNFSLEELRANLQKHMHHALHSAIEESIKEKLD